MTGKPLTYYCSNSTNGPYTEYPPMLEFLRLRRACSLSVWFFNWLPDKRPLKEEPLRQLSECKSIFREILNSTLSMERNLQKYSTTLWFSFLPSSVLVLQKSYSWLYLFTYLFRNLYILKEVLRECRFVMNHSQKQ